jgi:uncharacterized protein with HEPN domain
MKSDAIRELQAIFQNISYLDLVNDPLRMHAAVRLFEILGEASGKLSTEFRQTHPDIPFADMIGMRNKLIHHYFEVDLAVLWQTYEEDIPELQTTLLAALRDTP